MVHSGDDDRQIEFQHEEPGTFPGRTYSGQRVRLSIVRAMSVSHEAFKEASQQLDRLNRLLRRSIHPNSIPPSANLGGQQ
jgi:hypothetical protein